MQNTHLELGVNRVQLLYLKLPVRAALDWPGAVVERTAQTLNSPFRRLPGATAVATLLVAEFRLPAGRVGQEIVVDLRAFIAQRNIGRRALNQVGGFVDVVGTVIGSNILHENAKIEK